MRKSLSKVIGVAVCVCSLGTLAALQQSTDPTASRGGLIAHWSFEQAKMSGSDVLDQVGKLNATLMGSPALLTDKATFGVQFSAAEHGAMIRDKVTADAGFLPKEALSIAAWVRIDEGTEYGGIVGLMQDNGSKEHGFVLGYDQATFVFGLSTKGADDGDGQLTYLKAKTKYEPGRWYHVVGAYDGQEMRILVNGVAESTSRKQSGPINYAKSAPFVIGRYRDDDEDTPMKGAIREVKMYDRCLTDEESLAQFTADRAIADAAPAAAILGFVISPYLQSPTRDAITIMWETNLPSTSVIEYGKSVGTLKKIEDANPVTMHEVRLTDLEPSTRYVYVVSSVDAEGRTLKSNPLTFMGSAAKNEAFSFTVIGDTQKNPVITGKIAKLMWDRRPNFVIHCGDVVDNGSDKKEWTDELFKPSADLFGRVAVFPTIGNHEKNHAHYYKYFSLPKPEYYYRYQYGSIDFFSLDSNKSLKPGSEQYAWLDAELAKSDATFKICYHHHPIYTSDSDDYGKSFLGPNRWGDANAQSLIALYEKHNVDIVMNGHIHLYERTWPVREGKVDRKNGTTYITSGGGGGRLEDFTPTPSFFKAEGRVDYHYCYFTVHENKLVMKAFDQDGKLFDYFELTK